MDVDDEMGDERPMLTMLAEKVMHQEMNMEHVSYCPTMDLVAIPTIDGQVHVYRMNGQRVFGVSHKKADCAVTALMWKPNGPS